MSMITLPVSVTPTGGTVSISLEDLAAAVITGSNTQIRYTDGHLILGTLEGTIDLGALPGWGTPHITILTSGTSWDVPANWNNTNNKIELIGAGAPGSDFGGGGGPGGGYALALNYTLSAGSTVDYQIGTSSLSGGDTWFSSSSILMASGGKHDNGLGWLPGIGSGSAMALGYNGGGGGVYTSTHGGGSAGPNGNGGQVINGVYQSEPADGGTVPAGSTGVEWVSVGCGAGGTYPGGNGYGYGAGGAGTPDNFSGGNGSNGLIVITYYTLTP